MHEAGHQNKGYAPIDNTSFRESKAVLLIICLLLGFCYLTGCDGDPGAPEPFDANELAGVYKIERPAFRAELEVRNDGTYRQKYWDKDSNELLRAGEWEKWTLDPNEQYRWGRTTGYRITFKNCWCIEFQKPTDAYSSEINFASSWSPYIEQWPEGAFHIIQDKPRDYWAKDIGQPEEEQ